MSSERIFDVVLSIVGLAVISPIFLLAAWAISRDSSGPVFFRQVRIGKEGKPFRIYKFRTMVSDAEQKGMLITVGQDNRVTRIGKVLRKYKIDELPQLINVILGDMSLVGPRPEVPRYVAKWPADVRDEILSARPGITDFASIEFKDENALLEGAKDPEKVYVEQILPMKIAYYLKYVRERSLWLDVKLIFRTLQAIFL
jgi:lipopolysaccharide/colanic/teichoic acid biosynthesis glycosyltransferase